MDIMKANDSIISKAASLLIAALFTLSLPALHAQIDRSKMPEPGPAPEIQFKDYDSFTLDNGLKVFIIEDKKIPRVAMSLIVNRDPILEGDKAGYVGIAGDLLGEGTTNRNKETLYNEIEFIGGRISTSSTSVYARALSTETETVMEIMADVVKNPAFKKEAFDKLKKQELSGLKASENDPDAIASRVGNALFYGKDHPYGEVMTRETLENITVEDCKNYYNTYFKPNISYLAIVGDIKKRKAKKMVEKYFADWAKGDVPKHEYAMPAKRNEPLVAVVDRETAVQSVIKIGNVIDLKPGTGDVIPMSIMNQVLGGGSQGRLFQNLREDKAYTYGAYSGYGTDELVSTFRAEANVRNEVTDSAIIEFLSEFKKIAENKITEDELESAKNFRSGSFARSLESAQTIARFAINIDRYDMDKDYYKNYLTTIENVTRAGVQRVAEKHIDYKNPVILVVGKASEVAPKLNAFGEVKYFDIYGNEVDGAQPELPEDLTVQKVLNDYITALGGKDAIKSVKNMKVTRQAELQGQELTITEIYGAPNKSYSSVSMMGMNLVEMIFDGKKMKRTMQGQPQPADEEEIEQTKITAQLVPELIYLSNEKVNAELVKAANINGKAAYEVKVTYPDGNAISHYYDAESGLKVRDIEYAQAPNGEQVPQITEYGDYKAVNGFMVPYHLSIPIGPQSIEAKAGEVLINTDLPSETFKVD